MAPDYPSDLIQDIKIRLRQAAGVPSYDPSDAALPSVPSVADAVAALDATLPDYVRCKRCHGGLFRGINSTLCIFCGAEQRGDGISRTISFNSTAGYRKLLQSLDLDGSEMVNLEAESKDSSKGQDSSKGGVTLANFLNLELRWPRELEEIDNNNSNKAPSQVALRSISGVDLDKFFSDKKNEVSSRSNAFQVSAHGANSFSVDSDTYSAQNETIEQFMPREQGVNTHFTSSSRSPKFDFVDVVNSSADAKGGDSDDVADWETDFQSASSAIFEANSKQSEDFQSANPTAVSAESRATDLFHNPIDYQSANYETVGTESKQIDPFQNSSNIQPDNPTALGMETRTNNHFQNSLALQSATSEAVATDFRPIDLIQNPDGFPSTNLEKVAADSRHIDHLQNSCIDFSPIIISNSDQNTYIRHSSSKDDTDKDLTHEVDQLSTKISKETDKLEGISSTFVGEIKNDEKETTSVSISWTQDDLWQSSANEINNKKSLNHHDDDLFDDWQDFTTATDASRNLPILQSLTSDDGHVLPSKAYSGDVRDLEFGCFVQSDSFPVALNDLPSSRQGDDSIAHRTNQSNVKTGNSSSIYTGSSISEASDLEASRYKVDMLLAQMPDLSFMLEDSLYIPKNPSSSQLNT